MPKSGQVYFAQDEAARYPLPAHAYAPSTAYPEYPFAEISPQENKVYAMIRNGLYALGLDQEHFGQPEWNPLGTYIKEGQTVLLKPNWVMHRNPEKAYGDMACMVTHPSVIRAVLDYVSIALKGTGRIIVGDAPIQLCDFDALQAGMQYDAVWAYYRSKGVKLEILDFRGMVVQEKSGSIGAVLREADDGVLVRMDDCSAFAGLNGQRVANMRITNYPTHFLQEHHTETRHEYLLHPAVLQADVIINLPKPKSHRKAGLTACAKNFIGANMRKEYLPHHTMGSPAQGGDEYEIKSVLLGCASSLRDRFNNNVYKRKPASYLRTLSGFLRRAENIVGKVKNREGSWYGNDTIWRTIVDMHQIVLYADQTGVLQQMRQRRLFNICDMIVAGECEGPMSPSPKAIGVIVMGESMAAVDRTICKIVGFDPAKVKYCNPILAHEYIADEDILVVSADNHIDLLFNCSFSDELHLQPTEGWRGHIESNPSPP